MAKVKVIKDEVQKDKYGNGKMILNFQKNTLFGGEIYEIDIERNQEKKISICKFSKNDIFRKILHIFELEFYEEDKKKNTMLYICEHNGKIEKYDLNNVDIMMTNSIKKMQSQILKEFDFTVWTKTDFNESKSTVVDVITDVFDTIIKDDAVVNDKVMKDDEYIHMAIKGYFADLKENTEKVTF